MTDPMNSYGALVAIYLIILVFGGGYWIVYKIADILRGWGEKMQANRLPHPYHERVSAFGRWLVDFTRE